MTPRPPRALVLLGALIAAGAAWATTPIVKLHRPWSDAVLTRAEILEKMKALHAIGWPVPFLSSSEGAPDFWKVASGPQPAAMWPDLEQLARDGEPWQRELAVWALSTNTSASLLPFWKARLAANPPAAEARFVVRGLMRSEDSAGPDLGRSLFARSDVWAEATLRAINLDAGYADEVPIKVDAARVLAMFKDRTRSPGLREAATRWAGQQYPMQTGVLQLAFVDPDLGVRRAAAVVDGYESPIDGLIEALDADSLFDRMSVAQTLVNRSQNLGAHLTALHIGELLVMHGGDKNQAIASDAGLLLLMGRWHERNGDWARAQSTYAAALAIAEQRAGLQEPGSPRIELVVRLARLELLQGRREKGRAMLDRLLPDDYRDARVEFDLEGQSDVGLADTLKAEFEGPFVTSIRLNPSKPTEVELVVLNVSKQVWTLRVWREPSHALGLDYLSATMNFEHGAPLALELGHGETEQLPIAPGKTVVFPVTLKLRAEQKGRLDFVFDLEASAPGQTAFKPRLQATTMLR